MAFYLEVASLWTMPVCQVPSLGHSAGRAAQGPETGFGRPISAPLANKWSSGCPLSPVDAPCWCGTGWAHQTAPLGIGNLPVLLRLVVRKPGSGLALNVDIPSVDNLCACACALCAPARQLITLIPFYCKLPSACHADGVVSETAMSDEVSDFLRSVERLKERREEEDDARSRELEEKILQEKRERQARRAGMPTTPESTTWLFLHPSL